MAQWVCDLAVKHDAILVSADYRLLPEATCEEALDDIMDAYIWLSTGLTDALKSTYKNSPVIAPDLDRILVGGESAGGYCALQVGLTFFDQSSNSTSTSTQPIPKPRAIYAEFPYVSLRTPHWTQSYPKQIWNQPQLPLTLITSLFTSISTSTALNNGKRPIVSNIPMVSPTGQFTERAIISTAAEQHGRTLDFFGPERDPAPGKRRVFPEDRIEDGRILPPTMFLHGINDSIAPVEGMDSFVEWVRKYKAIAGMKEEREEREVMRYYRVPGEHFVATDMKLDGSEPEWLKEAVKFLEANWLGARNAAL